MAIDYPSEVERLVAELRKRDTDPRCKSWPIEDVYGRISHVNSGADTDKPIVQIYFTLREMLTRDVRLGELRSDTNRSAWKEDGPRPGWDDIVERLVAGASHGVSSIMIDRMMRQGWTLESLMHSHRRAHGRARGFTLYDVDSRKLYATNNVDDVSALRAKVDKAEADSAIKSRKILRANEARRLAGSGRNGPPPFGHRWGACGVDDTQLAAEREAIRWGIREVTDGKSWGHVARRWTADGVRPRRSDRWNAKNVRACLYGPDSTATVGYRHAGLQVHLGQPTGAMIVDDDGPIITLAEWHAFEAKVSGRRRGRQRGDAGESPYFASGTVRCGGTYDDGEFCGTLMVGSAGDYQCPHHGCGRVSVNGAAVEAFGSDLVAKAIVAGDNLALLAHVGHDDRLSELDKLIDDKGKALANIERQHDAATSATRRESIAARMVAAEAQLSTWTTERDELLEADRQARLKPTDVEELCALWNDDETPHSTRRSIMALCVPYGFYVRPVGRAARLRGKQIFTRFYEGKATA